MLQPAARGGAARANVPRTATLKGRSLSHFVIVGQLTAHLNLEKAAGCDQEVHRLGPVLPGVPPSY